MRHWHLNHLYTQRFNRSSKRDGHLFRGRYKAIVIEEDAYLVELMRYIHNNSVKHGLSKRSDNHQWSTHRYYLIDNKPDYLTTDRLLCYFGKRKNRARKKLHEFVLAGVPDKLNRCLSGNCWPSVLSPESSEEWINWSFVKDLDNKDLEYTPAYPEKKSENKLKKLLPQLLERDWKSFNPTIY